MDRKPWPQHPDGRNKKFGELSREEQREIVKGACNKLATEFADPERQRRMQQALDEAAAELNKRSR